MKKFLNKWQRANEWMADKLAFWLSTMACFYIVFMLVVVPLIWQHPEGLVQWMQYVVSVFFQGVALPVLGYVSRKGSELLEKLIREMHDAIINHISAKVDEIATNQAQENDRLRQIVEEQNEIIVQMHQLVTELHEKQNVA